MMESLKKYGVDIISYLFILLFVYAAISKVMDFETFQVQLGQSPILSAYAGVISYGVIATELIIAGLFIFKRTRLVAYYGGYMLMVAFTVYIYLILNFSDYIPCSCGGILEKMGWTEHLVFNVIFVVFALVGILFLSPFSKKNATSIIVAGIIAIGSMITLFFNSEYIIKQENNFTRRYLPHPIIEQEAINLGANSYYFAGLDAHKIYLGNYTAPLILTSINLDLKDVEKHRIELEQSNFNFRAITIKVFEDEFYVYDGNVPVIFKGCLPNYRAEIVSYNKAYFSQLVPLGNNNFAIKTHSSTLNQQVLGLVNTTTDAVILKNDILQKQLDGVFDSDGQINYDPITTKIVYNYYYRNQFIVMNENLEIQKSLHTIDTIQEARLKVTALKDGTNKMNAPPLLVNKNMNTYHNILFNESNLMGKHESQKQWKQASVIDMYFTDRNYYIGSFYVHHRQGEKLADFLVTDSHFYALIGNELIRYKWAPNVMKQFSIE